MATTRAQHAQRFADPLTADVMINAPAELVSGILGDFEGSARRVLVSLMAGHSRTLAAGAGGITYGTLRHWERHDPRFRAAVESAEAIGNGRFEGELYRRALAGPDDRGSMRALELVIKARMPEYRERQQTEITVIHRANQARAEVVGDWQPAEALPSPEA